jgi:Ca2+-binding EF-hand superfamily protein
MAEVGGGGGSPLQQLRARVTQFLAVAIPAARASVVIATNLSKTVLAVLGLGASKVGITQVPKGARIEKHRLSDRLTDEALAKMYDTFCELDKSMCGSVDQGAYLKFLDVPRSMLTLGIFELVACDHLGVMTFPEFVDIVCTFSVFETREMMQYLMYVLDPIKSGDADIKETEAFIQKMWNNEVDSNLQVALDYLKSLDDGSGKITYKDLLIMQKSYPSSFTPMYRLLNRIMSTCFKGGETYWEEKKLVLVEEREQKRRIEEMKKKAAQASIEAEEKRQFEEMVQKKMGIMYWLMPWTREAARSKVKKIQAINKQLEALEKAAADQMAKDAGKKK